MSGFVQCPACGGAIHAIASRCKHCKADLLQHKEAVAKQQRQSRQHKELRQTFRGAAPASGAASARATTSNPVHGPPPLGAHDGLRPVYTQPSGWSRRWPIAVSALAVVAIVASLIVLLTGKGDDDHGQLPSHTGNSPRAVPDDMGTPGAPLGSITPRPDPTDPFNPSGPKPKAWTTAPDPGMFAVALTESVCAKFEDCGLQAGVSQDICRELAKGLSSPDVDAKVQSGECSYDRSAASACLRAVDRLSCKLGLGGSGGGRGSGTGALANLMGQAAGLLDCSTALVCR